MSVRVGIGTFSGQVPPDGSQQVAGTYADMLALAQSAEAAGFDSFWVSSHHGMDNDHLPAPLVFLGAAAARTQRIRLGAAMVLAPFQSPIRFAEDCAVLDQLSAGRLTVGLGAGWREEEFRQFAVPMSERGARTAELARFCRDAWDRERITFTGPFHAFRDVSIRPRPYARIPIVMGGSAPAAIRRAGQLADMFLATGTPQGGLAAFRDQVEAFDAAAAQVGRDPRRLSIGFHVNGWVSKNGGVPDSVRHAMWNQIGSSIRAHAGAGDRPGIDSEEVRRRGFMGSPAQVTQACRPWIEAFRGRDLHVLFRLHYPGLNGAATQAAVRLFGDEVIPALRELGGGC